MVQAFTVQRSLLPVLSQPRSTLKTMKPSCSTIPLASAPYQSQITLKVALEMWFLLSCRLWRPRSRKEVRSYHDFLVRSPRTDSS